MKTENIINQRLDLLDEKIELLNKKIEITIDMVRGLKRLVLQMTEDRPEYILNEIIYSLEVEIESLQKIVDKLKLYKVLKND